MKPQQIEISSKLSTVAGVEVVAGDGTQDEAAAVVIGADAAATSA